VLFRKDQTEYRVSRAIGIVRPSEGMEGMMYRQFGGGGFTDSIDRTDLAATPIARSGSLDALVALERIGSRRTSRATRKSTARERLRIAGTRSSPARFASPSYWPTVAGISPSSASAAIASVSTIRLSVYTRPRRWARSS
jgi:hypothetical protein